jgi:hypothetical protein
LILSIAIKALQRTHSINPRNKKPPLLKAFHNHYLTPTITQTPSNPFQEEEEEKAKNNNNEQFLK